MAFVDRSMADFKAVVKLARQRIAQDKALTPGNGPILELAKGKACPISVLFLHGFSATPYEGRAFAAYLKRLGHNVYAPRVAGHGAGQQKFDHTPWSAFMESAEEGLRIARGLGRETILVGHSGGGVLATMLAARHPEQVKALVLGCPAFSLVNRKAWLTLLPPVRWAMGDLDFTSANEEFNLHWEPVYSVKTLSRLVKAGKKAEKYLFKLTLPLAIFQSSDDTIISTQGNLKRFARIASKRKQFTTYPSTEHNVFFKSNPFQKKVFGWIKMFIDEVRG